MAMKFNINKVICINLKSHNNDQLNSISVVYDLSLEALIELKSRGVDKIWVESGGDWVIAAVDSDSTHMYVCEKFCPITKKEKDKLEKIQPIKTPKVKKQSPIEEDNKIVQTIEKSKKTKSKKSLIILELDPILDKINESGIDCLSKEELDFLKNYK